jgi:hypothetical protein
MRVSNQQDAVHPALQTHAQQPARLTVPERAQLYHAVFGVPGGASGAVPANAAFQDLWLRFVSGAAQLGRQSSPQLAAGPAFATHQVRADARELAAAANPWVQSAMAGRDQWQVVDRLDQLELGGAVNVARHRELALAGGTILEWLAGHAGTEVADGMDDDLVQACERWLAVTATSDDQVQALSRPAATEPSPIVSKYIGETEKNLDTLFGCWPPSRARLLFDEADALFGKCSAAKDSHD